MVAAGCGSSVDPAGTTGGGGNGGGGDGGGGYGLDNPPECPADEPMIMGSCATPDLACAYGDSTCAHELKCKAGEWSFESTTCNPGQCPIDDPAQGKVCAAPGLTCIYGQPVPNDAPCADNGWGQAVCSAETGTWQIVWYDSVCPPGCPDDTPTNGDPCNPELWAPECSFDVSAECGAAKVTAKCAPLAMYPNQYEWSVTDPVCGG